MVIEDAMQNLVAILHKDLENEPSKGRRPPLFLWERLAAERTSVGIAAGGKPSTWLPPETS